MQLTTVHLIVLILATYRLASLLADEPGPWEILEKFRTRIGIIYVEDSKTGERDGKNELARNVLCTWCNSLYLVAPFWTILYILLGDIAVLIALPFALSTAAIYIERLIWRGIKRKFSF